MLGGRLSGIREFEAEKCCAVSMRCGLCVELSRLRNCANAPVPVPVPEVIYLKANENMKS
jgi:hypothetical protein